MPSPSRRAIPPPPRISRNSPRRQRRTPDRSRRAGPPSSRLSGSSSRPISPSRPRERRRTPEHASRHSPDSRSRPSSNRLAESSRRSRSPVAVARTGSNGRSFSAASRGKRKASPKREIPRGRESTERNTRTVIPPRSASKEGPQIPLIGPADVSPPPSRKYSRPAPLTATRRYPSSTEQSVSLRNYPGSSATATATRGYPASDSPPPSLTYTTTTSRSYVEPSVVKTDSRNYVPMESTSSRGYSGSAATAFRRSSEERIFQRTSAQNRATLHLTSSRFAEFAGLRDDDDEAALLRSEEMDFNSSDLNGIVINLDNGPSAKYPRTSRGVVRNIVHPETLHVVRRPGEGARPIFERHGTQQPPTTRLVRADDNHGRNVGLPERLPVPQVARYVSPEPPHREVVHSRNGQSHLSDLPPRTIVVARDSRALAPVSRDSRALAPVLRDSRVVAPASRDIPSHSRPTTSSHSARPAKYYQDSLERDRDYHSTRDYEREEPSSLEHRSSRPIRHEEHSDLRRELEQRRDTSRHSQERGRVLERGRDHHAESDSDLRERINEKRTTRSTERTYTTRVRTDDRRRSRERIDDRNRERERSDNRGRALERTDDRGRARERQRSPSDEHRRPSESYDRSRSRVEPSSRSRQHRDTTPPPERYHEEQEDYHETPRPWEIDPEFVPRGRAYFEHDNREGHMMMRGRGNLNMRGGFVYRGRAMMRPPMRGTPFNRGGYIQGRGAPAMRRGYGAPRGFIAIGARRPYAIRRPFIPIRRPYAVAPPRRPGAPVPASIPTMPKPTPPNPTPATPTPSKLIPPKKD